VIINTSNLSSLFIGFKTSFNMGFERAPSHYETVAMVTPSSTTEEEYGWLGSFPQMREWVGERVINNLALHNWLIRNRKFENTISVQREKIEDDRFGVFGPIFEEMGRDVKQHPDELVFALLADGFNGKCYDGQYFFDTDHPVLDASGAPQSVSNMQTGSDEPWFLVDASRAIKPIVWQTRIPYAFQSLDDDRDSNVFFRDEYIYGVRARVNAGYGLWQLAFGSKAPLTAANYELARAAMVGIKGDHGRKLKIRPTHLICGSASEGAARRLLNRGNRVEDVGGTPVAVSNEWEGSVDLIVTPHLD
jgi:phage major head subunit gpT-like protein